MPWSFYSSSGELRLGIPSGGLKVGDISPSARALTGSFGSTAQAESAPDGFLFCNGAEVARSAYPDLFNFLDGLGLPYGAGNGTTTFNIPDMLDLFVMGRADETVSSLANSGSATHDHLSVTSHLHAIPTHVHTITDTHTHTLPSHTHTMSNHQHNNGTIFLNNTNLGPAVGVSVAAGTVSVATHAHTHAHAAILNDVSDTVLSFFGAAATGPATGATTVPGYAPSAATTGTAASNSDLNTTVSMTPTSNVPPHHGVSYLIKAVR